MPLFQPRIHFLSENIDLLGVTQASLMFAIYTTLSIIQCVPCLNISQKVFIMIACKSQFHECSLKYASNDQPVLNVQYQCSNLNNSQTIHLTYRQDRRRICCFNLTLHAADPANTGISQNFKLQLAVDQLNQLCYVDNMTESG